MVEAGQGNPIGTKLLEAAAEQLALAAQFLALPGDERHRGVHQARKSLRRARAIVALGERKLGPAAVRLGEQIRSLGRGLSALRDAQALVETLERLKHQEPEVQRVFARALGDAHQRRAAVLSRFLAADPDLASRQRRIREFVQRLQALPWSKVGETTVRKALARSQRRIEAAQHKLASASRSEEAWHRLRRRVRRLRQQHTVVDELAPHLHVHIAKEDPRAELLGDSQDDALLLTRSSRRSPFHPEDRKVLRAVARRRLKAVREKLGQAAAR